MSYFEVSGGRPLNGVVRLGGAKNASFKLMIASLLIKDESRLLNFSRIEDIEITKKIIMSLGGGVRKAGVRTLFINGSRLIHSTDLEKWGSASRASTMFIPVLLHRLYRAEVPLPGGDKIGTRPLDRHFEGLIKMGARIKLNKQSVLVEASQLTGTKYKFSKNTHTGTETLIMAGVLAKGKTILENAALEPEIDDLIEFLNKAGGKIKRKPGKIIEIEGVSKLNPVIHKIMPDRNEAVSYAVAGIASKGDIIVENARPEHLSAFLSVLKKMNAGYEIGNYGIRFFYKGKLKPVDVITNPHPGFMTDWQPLLAVLMTQCHGTSSIIEAVHPFRFHYINTLREMGAGIKQYDPLPDRPDKFYNFDLANDSQDYYHGIRITGPKQLRAVSAFVPDLRAGATMVLASVCAHGVSTIKNIEHIERGYEDFDRRLRQLGAKITRVNK